MSQDEDSKKTEKKLKYQRPELIPLGSIKLGLEIARASGSAPGRGMDCVTITQAGDYYSTLLARVRGVTSKDV